MNYRFLRHGQNLIAEPGEVFDRILEERRAENGVSAQALFNPRPADFCRGSKRF